MQGGVNLTSLLFMNIYRIYIFIVWFVFTPFWWLTKMGREIRRMFLSLYACLFLQLVYAYMFLFIQKGRSILHLCMFMLSIHCISLFYCYAWVKGELLWSLTLIHEYITPWVLSSSKRGRLLAQRPFTLVLMIINSCSYSLLIILWYLVSEYLIKILVGD